MGNRCQKAKGAEVGTSEHTLLTRYKDAMVMQTTLYDNLKSFK